MARVAAAVAMLPVVLGGGSLRANMGASTFNVARNVRRPLFLYTTAAAAVVPVCCTYNQQVAGSTRSIYFLFLFSFFFAVFFACFYGIFCSAFSYLIMLCIVCVAIIDCCSITK